jgi:predicted glycoside hydrolase/deacetylase ChbG (UPF0249 family)
LVDPQTGRFHATLGAFLKRLLTSRIRDSDIEAEAEAQIVSLKARGVRLTHIDTHKHAHMFPPVLRPVLRAAKAAGIRRVRNPFEPPWSLQATPAAPFARRAEVRLLRWLEPAFRRIVAEEGFCTSDGALGVLATGTLNSGTIASLLAAMPAGNWELVTHPGYNDDALATVRTRLLASREIERNALLTIDKSSSFELISFASLDRKPISVTQP